MPELTANGITTNVPESRRLVLAIEEGGVRIGHRCGGQCRCTTCRVEFIEGEPADMTQAEFDKLQERGLLGQVRLSCQIACEHDVKVQVPMTAENQPDWGGSTGPTPGPEIVPEAKRHPVEALKNKAAA
jgi:ferredoxin